MLKRKIWKEKVKKSISRFPKSRISKYGNKTKKGKTGIKRKTDTEKDKKRTKKKKQTSKNANSQNKDNKTKRTTKAIRNAVSFRISRAVRLAAPQKSVDFCFYADFLCKNRQIFAIFVKKSAGFKFRTSHSPPLCDTLHKASSIKIET